MKKRTNSSVLFIVFASVGYGRFLFGRHFRSLVCFFFGSHNEGLPNLGKVCLLFLKKIMTIFSCNRGIVTQKFC